MWGQQSWGRGLNPVPEFKFPLLLQPHLLHAALSPPPPHSGSVPLIALIESWGDFGSWALQTCRRKENGLKKQHAQICLPSQYEMSTCP